MTAVLAFDDDVLVGALPFEMRRIRIGDHEDLPVLWVSAAHVEPAYRSQGIGRRLDLFARSQHRLNFDALCAYREDERSPAYRWYVKMGYHPLLPILAFRKKVDSANIGKLAEPTEVLSSPAKIAERGAAILDCFTRIVAGVGGYPMRHSNFWAHLMSAHYYKDAFSAYAILALSAAGNAVDAYALLGRTEMRDGVDRLDVLEFIAEEARFRPLLSAIEEYAASMGVTEIRIQTAAQESLRTWIEFHGFEYRDRRNNFMASLIDPSQALARKLARHNIRLAIDIETPERRIVSEVTHRPDVEFFMSENTLHELFFHRIGLDEAIDAGHVVLLRGSQYLRQLDSMFFPAPWRFFQADHI